MDEDVVEEPSGSESEMESKNDLAMLVDVTQKFANIATSKKQQMTRGIALLQQQEKYRDQVVRNILVSK